MIEITSVLAKQPAVTEVHSPNCFGKKVHEVNIGLVRHRLPSGALNTRL